MKKLFLIAGLSLSLFTTRVVAQVVASDTLFLTVFTDSMSLGEVVVKAKKTTRANSRWSDMKPIELATAGGANGDLYQALQTLPGTQVQGESGRLLVRGGSSNETQTYMDGMHVLNPYTTTGVNTPARGRYSTFMFSGVNLASGGQQQEYGEALSAVLLLLQPCPPEVSGVYRAHHSPICYPTQCCVGAEIYCLPVANDHWADRPLFQWASVSQPQPFWLDERRSETLQYTRLGHHLPCQQKGNCSRFRHQHLGAKERIWSNRWAACIGFQRPLLLYRCLYYAGQESCL